MPFDHAPITTPATDRDVLALRLVASALTQCALAHETADAFRSSRACIAASAEGAIRAASQVAESTLLRAQLHTLWVAAAQATGMCEAAENTARWSEGFRAGRVSQ